MTIDTSIHRRTWDQIPWILNGTLPEEELRAAAQHLQTCSDCREELEFQRHIAQSLGGSDPEDVDPQRSWQRLRARIEADTPIAPLPAITAAQTPQPRWTGWLVAAMIVQAIGLGVLGTMLWSRQASPGAPVYRTLSASAPATAAAATIRVVFADDMSLGRMQALLNQSGLMILSGPSSAGVWSLGPVGDSRHTAMQPALQQLRGSADVRSAEAVGGSPQAP